MRITDLFKSQQDISGVSTESGKSVNKTDSEEQARQRGAEQVGAKGEDRITISPLYRQITQIARVVREDEALQAEKVERLKAQVASGNYFVSSEDVAGAFLSHAAENNLDL